MCLLVDKKLFKPNLIKRIYFCVRVQLCVLGSLFTWVPGMQSGLSGLLGKCIPVSPELYH